MKTKSFELLLKTMNPNQQFALEELEKIHSDLMWDGGRIDTRPLRVSIKNVHGQNMAAINTREKNAFLKLEFRSKDYNGPNVFPTKHKNFDKCYELIDSSSTRIASEMITRIKQNYA